MRSFNPGPMAIALFERFGVLALACRKQGLHPLLRLQGQGASRVSSPGGPIGTDLPIELGKRDRDDGVAFAIPSRCPA